MTNTNETIADIIAEKRRLAEQIRNNLSTVPVRQWDQQAEIKSLEDEADRLDAAHRRERVDCAKLRDALVQVQKKINYLIGNLTVPNSLVANRMEINGIINAALAAPPRNCDVGTAEEQSARFDKFCHANINTQRCCGDCPAFRTTRDDCELVWAQMSYEEKEGGAK